MAAARSLAAFRPAVQGIAVFIERTGGVVFGYSVGLIFGDGAIALDVAACRFGAAHGAYCSAHAGIGARGLDRRAICLVDLGRRVRKTGRKFYENPRLRRWGLDNGHLGCGADVSIIGSGGSYHSTGLEVWAIAAELTDCPVKC